MRKRSKKDYTRRKPFKPPRDVILIVCEGAKTEPNYFESIRKELRLSTIEVEVTPSEKGSAAISVVDYALEKIEHRRLTMST